MGERVILQEVATRGRRTLMGTRHAALAVFLFLIALYLLTYNGAFHIVDEVSMFAVADNLVRCGHLDTDQVAWMQWVNSPAEVLGSFGRGGHVYSKKGSAPSLLVAPLVWVATRIPGLGKVQTAFFLNVLVTAATGALVVLYVRAMGYSARVAMVCGLLFGSATIAWPYSRQFFGEPVSALGLTLGGFGLLQGAWDGRSRWFALAGLGLTLAMTTATINVVMVPLYLLYAWLTGRAGEALRVRERRGFSQQMSILLGFVTAGLAGVGAYNWLRFGDPLCSGYHFGLGEGFTADLLQGLYGLTLSPYRGFLWYTPAAWLALAAFPHLWRRHHLEAVLWGGLLGFHLLIFSAWWMWWGGFAWGPRFLVPLAPFVAASLAPLLAGLIGIDACPCLFSRLRRLAVVGILVLSMAVQILACGANFSVWEIELRDLYPTDWSDPLRYAPPALYNPLHSPILGQLRLLAAGRLDLAWLRPGWWDPVALGGLLVLLAYAGWVLLRAWRGNGLLPGPSATTHLAVGGLLTIAATALLLSRIYHNPIYGTAGRGYAAILEEVEAQSAPDDALITVAPYHYHVPMNRYRGRLPILGLAEEPTPPHAEAVRLLERYAASHRRVWFITVGLHPAAPSNGAERWLSEHAYLVRQTWYDDCRLLLYAGALSPVSPQSLPGQVVFESGLALTGVGWSPESLLPDGLLMVETRWTARQPPEDDYVLFLQLLDPDGALVVGHDGPPAGGYEPTGQWQMGQAVTDRRALQLPSELPSGTYRLGLGWYDPMTGTRLPVVGAASDWLEVARLEVP